MLEASLLLGSFFAVPLLLGSSCTVPQISLEDTVLCCFMRSRFSRHTQSLTVWSWHVPVWEPRPTLNSPFFLPEAWELGRRQLGGSPLRNWVGLGELRSRSQAGPLPKNFIECRDGKRKKALCCSALLPIRTQAGQTGTLL